MNRRDWLRRAALLATGAIAADQLELMERLTHRRRLWAGHGFPPERVYRYQLGWSGMSLLDIAPTPERDAAIRAACRSVRAPA